MAPQGGWRPSAAVAWSAAEAAAAGLFSFASAFFVARLVGPAALGIGAAVVSVHVLLWVGVNALFADALVQRATWEEATGASAFWASAVIGGLAALVQAGAGLPLAWLFADRRIPLMALVLAGPLPLVGAAGAVQGRLTRERRYRLLASRVLFGQGAGTAVGCAAAWGGAGAWAVVAQQAVTSAAGAAVLLVGAGWWPRPRRVRGAVRGLLRIGGPLTLSTLVLHGRYRVFLLLLGGEAGPRVLGEVHMAFRLVDSLRELVSTALWRLLLPVFSECQARPAALRAAMERALAQSGRLLFPLCGAMLVGLGPATRLLLGPGWGQAAAATAPLVALAAWQFLTFPAGAATVARGAPGVALRANLMSLGLLVAGVLGAGPAAPLAAVGLWCAALLAPAPYALRASARVVGAPVWHLLRAGMPALLVAAAASLLAIGVPALAEDSPTPAWALATRLAVGLAVIGPGLWGLARVRRTRRG
ncbi:MAG: oligosaccharide flippase family protein [Rhodospirillales bacterium]|nr:oligosaccharide flippase family protein [Rhodospirillales bacterium]